MISKVDSRDHVALAKSDLPFATLFCRQFGIIRVGKRLLPVLTGRFGQRVRLRRLQVAKRVLAVCIGDRLDGGSATTVDLQVDGPSSQPGLVVVFRAIAIQVVKLLAMDFIARCTARS